MEVMLKHAVETPEKERTQTAKKFWKEFAQGYFEVEEMKKQKELKEYIEAYDNIEDKNSFNAQYLETLIYNLKH